MPFTPKAHSALFSSSRRRPSYVPSEESEVLASDIGHSHSAGMQPSASTSWINPFGRASFSIESTADDTYVPPSSLPTSRRPSAATIISTLLHSVAAAGGSNVRSSQDGSSSGISGDENASKVHVGSPPAVQTATTTTGSHARRPSAIIKAWKARRGSQSNQAAAAAPSSLVSTSPIAFMGFAQGRRKSSALTRVLQPSALRNNTTTARVDEHHSLATDDTASSDTRRRSLSIVCRGERDSDELDPTFRSAFAPPPPRPQHNGGGKVTAAMAIRDTWLYGEHHWRHEDGRKGSDSTVATSPTYSMRAVPGSKSFSIALGLDEEDQRIEEEEEEERRTRNNAIKTDTISVVSLSLTEEIALYTSDNNAGVKAVEQEVLPTPVVGGGGGVGRRGTAVAATTGAGEFVWNLPDWGSSRTSQQLPMLSPAPAMIIADPFSSASMQRVESGSLDPMLSPIPASSPTSHTPTSQDASHGHDDSMHHRRPSAAPTAAVQWSHPQWNSASPFNPDAPSSHRPSFAANNSFTTTSGHSSYHSTEDQSPTAPNFPPPPPSPKKQTPAITIVQPKASVADDSRRRATTYYDASPLPVVDEIPRSPTCEFPLPALTPSVSASTVVMGRSPRSPRSPRSFGHSETYEMSTSQRRLSFSLPRPPAGYTQQQQDDDDDASLRIPTPRLVGVEFGETTTASPMSSTFEPETPVGGTTFPELEMVKKVMPAEEGDDLHAQFCSVLLLDLGDGTAIPLSPSPTDEPRPDPFALTAF